MMSDRVLVWVFSLVVVLFGAAAMVEPSAEGAEFAGFASGLCTRYAHVVWKGSQR
jgi:hypothetical protein